ncbi:HAD superfamily hydrolase (TIGR01450 family) [Prauserella shujinwangii]|uniref:HAD superfamily hydrolase (TIGR01450 family) n=1 Tax=Prauserella shujinwangii TaxID=1453103 RepID=A0A2T0LRY3_9PSEU|nr:HAD-IIA family hydrolase [Prauserella shujinwangii]PRX46222.1 HAD superfamily hydrolase (TIGR01450 family) [Prauserella shujinwangii]
MSDPALLARHDAVLLDLDGTVYHGARPIPSAAESIARVRELGTPVRFVTNNASKSPGAVAAHLRGLGVAAEAAEVSTSAQAAARLLRERIAPGAAVLVVGTEALAAEVEAAGLRPVRQASDDVAAVVQGHSPDTAWADLAEACLRIRAGAVWVACNADATLPTERGQLPGNGAMVAALRAATGREPDVAGKPRAPLFRTAAESAGARAPLVVGDRLDTDIEGAAAAGLAALAVLTGVGTPAALLAAEPAQRPRYLAADLSALTGKSGELEIGPRPGWRVRADGPELTATSDGARDAVDLLRTLCAAAWRHGTTRVRPGDDHAGAALAELGLA